MSFINIINESFDKQNKKILAGAKSKKLKEDVEKVYKYIVVNHFSPEDFYLIKSNHPVDENMFDAWNFLDVTDKHGKGTVVWNDEYIDFNESGDKSIADLDDEYRKEMVRYLSDLEKKGDLDKIKDDYLALDELQYQGYLTDFPVWIDPGDGDGVLEDYMNDKTLKSSYLATMYSDYLENSYVDNDSSSAAVYIDIDDLTQYTDYEEFFDEDGEDEEDDGDEENKEDKASSIQTKIEELKNLDHIPNSFFMEYPITSINIPSNIKSIGDYAFAGCTDLKNIKIPDSVTSIGWAAFWVCSGLTNITIPDGVTSIGGSAFLKCSSLKNITLPSSITNIDNETFAECSGLTSIIIPDSVTSIGDYAFFKCSNLKSIKIPNSVTSIGEQAFYSCTGLTSVVIGNSVKSIGDWSFRNCAELTRITIPSSVISIGYKAFMECENLKEITYKGTKADWNKIEKQPAWNYYSSIKTIHCTDGDIEIENER